MAEIPLQNGGVALIDDEDLALVNKTAKDWYAQELPNGKVQVVGIKNDGKTVRLHRLVFGFDSVYYIDGNGLNNQKSNMEPSGATQMAMNAKKRKRSGSSKYKGVFWHKGAWKWKAQIYKNGEAINLGYFTDEIEAAKAYDKAALELFGKYACPNFKLRSD